MSDLLEKLGLTDRQRDGTEMLRTEDMWAEIDWKAAHSRLEAERMRSGDFLCNGIKR